MNANVKEAYELDAQVGYLLRLASQRHTGLFQSHMSEGLTPTQFSALLRLSEEGSCSQNQLGRRASMDIATIKGVVDRLRQKELVTATPSKTDKRLMIVALTHKGRSLITPLMNKATQISKDTLAPLTKAEQTVFLSLLKKLT